MAPPIPSKVRSWMCLALGLYTSGLALFVILPVSTLTPRELFVGVLAVAATGGLIAHALGWRFGSRWCYLTAAVAGWSCAVIYAFTQTVHLWSLASPILLFIIAGMVSAAIAHIVDGVYWK